MKLSRAFFAAALLCAGMTPAPALAQRTIVGEVPLFTTHGTGPSGAPATGAVEVSFTCTGSPTCTGSYIFKNRFIGCPNTFVFSGGFTATGLDTDRSGPLQGQFVLENGDADDLLVNGTCNIRVGTSRDFAAPYDGHWNADSGTGEFFVRAMGDDGAMFNVPGTLKGDPAPRVFPMVVRANIDAATATAAADIQFRPQDVGTTGSVFVFATAPAAQVRGGNAPGAMKIGLARNDVKAFQKAEACVISQVNPAGQLVAVTSAQLQAFLSGTLSAAGASVSILNGVPTPNVAGATFYVGYGTSAQRMLTDGIFRNAVLVPGSDVCPMMPAHTALWWNSRESGWGINLNHQGSTLFGTLFTYDANRAPMWLVMSGGSMQSDGVTYTGELYRTTGPAFNANPFTPIGPSNLTRVGMMTIKFGDANAGTLTYTVNNVQVVKDIQRQVYGSRAANCLPTSESRVASTNYQDLWWNPAESGWGLNVTHQDNTLFATLFTYDASGRDLWLVMSGGARQADGSFLGELYQTAGPVFNTASFSGVTVQTVGTMRLRFTDGNTGTLTYTYNGVTVTKAIQRQVFSTTFSACH